VSDFVKGVVRRGAGLPSPVAVLPAGGQTLTWTALQSVDDAGPLAEAQIPSNDEQAVTFPLRPAQNPRGPIHQVEQPAGLTPGPYPGAVQWAVAPTRIEPQITLSPVRQQERPQALQDFAPAIDSEPPADSEPRPQLELSRLMPADRTEQQANSSAAVSQMIPQPGEKTSQPRQMHPGVAECREAMPVREQKPEAIAPRPTATSLPSVGSHETARDSRNIQVRIGKVEIRSSQPPTIVQAVRRAPTNGFDDLKMVRNYFSRG